MTGLTDAQCQPRCRLRRSLLRAAGALRPTRTRNATTAYLNTIPTHLQAKLPGDPEMERRVRALVRWNAIMTVLRANEKAPGVGGHIASFQSAATLYDTGFNYFFQNQMKNLVVIVFIFKATHLQAFMLVHF